MLVTVLRQLQSGGYQPLTGDDALSSRTWMRTRASRKICGASYSNMVDELATMAGKWLEEAQKP
jgi:hypothetical protein